MEHEIPLEARADILVSLGGEVAPPQSFSSLHFFNSVFRCHQVSEACVFRATTHHSDGVDIHLKLTVQGDLLGSSWGLLVLSGSSWGPLGVLLGSFWGPLGVVLGSSGSSSGPLGILWGPDGF